MFKTRTSIFTLAKGRAYSGMLVSTQLDEEEEQEQEEEMEEEK